jgi:hypothetical protein
VKAGGNTSEAVANARLQVQRKLDSYNALVIQPSTDMTGDYKKLMKSMDSMNDKMTEARVKIEAMQKAASDAVVRPSPKCAGARP